MELTSNILQPFSSAEPCSIKMAIDAIATQSGTEARGAVFTRTEVVDFILDIIGYTKDQPLHKNRILEPSFGGGDFLIPIIGRLLIAWRADLVSTIDDLRNSIRAFELHQETFHSTYLEIVDLLKYEGFNPKAATDLADHWLSQDDFLLAPLDGEFHYVVGNPPYVRQELIPATLLAEYRRRYKTIYDRADLYIPFIERSLSTLARGGHLGFICADRWMKNRYGGPLRRFIAEQFHLKIYVDMTNTIAFRSDVMAYPAITVIANEKYGITRIAHQPDINRTRLIKLSNTLKACSLPKDCDQVRELNIVAQGSEPWLLDSLEQITLIRQLEKKFPTIEEASCKIGIGVATGADRAFIGNFDSLDVEDDRKLPLVTTHDILSGEVTWRGEGVINPFIEGGGLVNLRDYPRLHRYLEDRHEIIARRHCAQKSPDNWYRTIDRINPALMKKPKLLIPDIKSKAHIVFEEGMLYPHHNLYYVTSEKWDLRALQAVLLSNVTRLFVATYSTKMRGGFLRFQAQYLRRIRLPYWENVPIILRTELINAAINKNTQACNHAAFKLYGLNYNEQTFLDGTGE